MTPALRQATGSRVDDVGQLCLDGVPLGRTGEQLYRADELDGSIDANPAGFVVVRRLPEDVFNVDALASFEGKPVVIEHGGGAVGFVRNVRRGEGERSEFVVGDVVLFKPLVATHLERLYPDMSLEYVADYERGGPGLAFQRNIRGTYVAAVPFGRAWRSL